MRLQQGAAVVLNSFKVAHIFGYLLPFLRNITALLDAGGQRLDLHLAVYVREEVFLG